LKGKVGVLVLVLVAGIGEVVPSFSKGVEDLADLVYIVLSWVVLGDGYCGLLNIGVA